MPAEDLAEEYERRHKEQARRQKMQVPHFTSPVMCIIKEEKGKIYETYVLFNTLLLFNRKNS